MRISDWSSDVCSSDRKARMAAWGAVPSTVTLTDSTKLAANAAAHAAVATTNIDTNLIERTTQDAVRAAARNVWVAVWFAVWGAVNATLGAGPSGWGLAGEPGKEPHRRCPDARRGTRGGASPLGVQREAT